MLTESVWLLGLYIVCIAIISSLEAWFLFLLFSQILVIVKQSRRTQNWSDFCQQGKGDSKWKWKAQ